MTIARDLSKILDANGDLTIDTSTLFVDSSTNRVGIGTTSPSYPLVVSGGGSLSNNDTSIGLDISGTNHIRQRITTPTSGGYQASLALESNSNEVVISTAGSNEIRFTTNASEAMRIDSSGNVLIGQSSVSTSSAGSIFTQSGKSYHIATSDIALALDRKTTDGQILQIRKDQTVLGGIGSNGGDIYISSTTSGHKGLRFGNGAIVPTTTDGGTDDNATNLGGSTQRFASAFFGGTVTANAFSGDGSGLTNVNQPYFIAGNNTPQNLTNGVSTGINLQTEDVDSDGCFNNTGSATTLNGISVDAYSFAPNVAGYYVIGASVHFQTVADGTSLEMMIMKNQGAAIRNMIHSANSSKDVNPHCSLLIYANGSTDDFQLQVRLDGASDNTYYNSNYVRFWGFRVV